MPKFVLKPTLCSDSMRSLKTEELKEHSLKRTHLLVELSDMTDEPPVKLNGHIVRERRRKPVGIFNSWTALAV